MLNGAKECVSKTQAKRLKSRGSGLCFGSACVQTQPLKGVLGVGVGVLVVVVVVVAAVGRGATQRERERECSGVGSRDNGLIHE
jgi:hypothetical protein